ncbi:MAG: M20/M25/M40 family metallo-hydrolase [Acidobacteria bacterium]|nr:M20/M25/M40 family metallo-hydrolase [Acidobacteriota bacterium]MBV9478205.1 M20/M25/M40 family metallo-hydrolase [Acidobacteriota bacterium]
MPLDPIALARQLIDAPSPTGEEAAVGELLDAQLSALGFTTRRHAVTDTRFNLFASAGGRPRVVLNSHIDTVPPWFASREDDAHVYGRGACDTKGIIPAMLAAGERLLARGIRDFAYLFVVGEETDSIGAKTANEAFADLGSEFVVVGEPTESKFARASKGAFTATVRFAGVAAHSAYPHLGDSAINRMVAAIDEINRFADWGADDVLGNATVNVGVVRGGEKPNIVPAWAECEMIFRLVTTPEDVRQKLETLVARHGGAITAARGNPPQRMIVPAGQPSAVVAFNTDVPWLGNLGQPLLFGPGSILDAHGVDEKIGKRELLDAVATYESMVISLLEGNVT